MISGKLIVDVKQERSKSRLRRFIANEATMAIANRVREKLAVFVRSRTNSGDVACARKFNPRSNRAPTSFQRAFFFTAKRELPRLHAIRLLLQ